MKVLSIIQIREADKYTIEKEPITSIDLMERAAKACVDWIIEQFDISTNFKIVCGQGNNGGDGLAIARLLSEEQYKVQVVIVHHSENHSSDFISNYESFRAINDPVEINSIQSFHDALHIDSNSVIIDALLGSGLNKPVMGLLADCISFINKLAAPVISIDMPSGLYADVLNDPTDIIVRANYTLSFQFPKLSFMFTENAKHVGEFSVLDIGLHSEYITHASTQHHFITRNDAGPLLKTRNKIAHKGNFGHALLVSGSYGKMGAAILASKACMRSGVGLLTAHIPKCGYNILQTAVPEVMVEADSESNYISENIKVEKYNVIGIGPGIGTEKQTQNVVKLLIQNSSVPLVFDADAINIISENKTWLSFISANCIFTPHPKEFERLAGKSANTSERLQLQRDFALKYKAYVIVKGAHTSISCPDGSVFFNSTGNPGMATAGSGDVLTGIITSLLAQGYTSQHACILGVYLHGLAGDFAAYEKTEESMIASDIVESMGEAFRFLTSS
ncbi:MAG: NAD(P)H-hydrate dehydratase [Bacteroidota bacterium]